MLKSRLLTALAVLGLLGFAACGDDGEDIGTIETQEVVTTPEVETVEVPVVTQEPAMVETEVDIDADVDTVDVP